MVRFAEYPPDVIKRFLTLFIASLPQLLTAFCWPVSSELSPSSSLLGLATFAFRGQQPTLEDSGANSLSLCHLPVLQMMLKCEKRGGKELCPGSQLLRWRLSDVT